MLSICFCRSDFEAATCYRAVAVSSARGVCERVAGSRLVGCILLAESMGIDGLVKMMIRRGIERYCNVVFILHFSWHNGSLTFNGFYVLKRVDYFFLYANRVFGLVFSFSLANN